MRLWVLFVALATLQLPVALADAQDDAGSGGDAPGDVSSALPLAPGSYQGTLAGDDRDAYRFTGARSQALLVEFGGQVGVASLLDSNGVHLDHSFFGGALAAATPYDGVIVLVLQPICGTCHAQYSFHASLIDIADVAVEGIRLELTSTALGGADQTYHVQAEVVNRGRAASEPALVRARVSWVEGSGADTSRHLGQVVAPALAPGESATVAYRWDATGQVGAFRVRVRAAPDALDGIAHNDEAVRRHDLLVGLLPGIDALNVRFRDVGTTSDGSEHGVVVPPRGQLPGFRYAVNESALAAP